MDIGWLALLGAAIFFLGLMLITVLLGAFAQKDEREILRRNADDIASGGGSMTPPPSQNRPYRDSPV
jgi:hypothetical protein